MHPTVSCYLAPARIADPCDQAQRDTPARAARRGRPGKPGRTVAGPLARTATSAERKSRWLKRSPQPACA